MGLLDDNGLEEYGKLIGTNPSQEQIQTFFKSKIANFEEEGKKCLDEFKRRIFRESQVIFFDI